MPDGTLIDLYYLTTRRRLHNIVASCVTAFSAVGVATSHTGSRQSNQPDSSNTDGGRGQGREHHHCHHGRQGELRAAAAGETSDYKHEHSWDRLDHSRGRLTH
jgi:hypothetical protein